MLKISSSVFLSFMTLAASNSSFAQEVCRRVNAVGFGQDQGEGQTFAWVTGNPLLVGKTQGTFQVESVTGSLASIAGTVEFEGIQGTFTLVARGSFDLASGRFTSGGPIEDGSGIFAGASGQLELNGKQDLDTGRFIETIRGTICWSE